jgi:hypothetical protein
MSSSKQDGGHHGGLSGLVDDIRGKLHDTKLHDAKISLIHKKCALLDPSHEQRRQMADTLWNSKGII